MCSDLISYPTAISFPELRSPWPAVEKRELWEHPFQVCTIACHRCRLRLRSEPDNQNSVISYCYFKMDAPRALVFRPLVKENEALGTRLIRRSSYQSCYRPYEACENSCQRVGPSGGPSRAAKKICICEKFSETLKSVEQCNVM